LMEGAELDAMVADIVEQGLLEPIVRHDGLILDGRNRYRACDRANVEPRFVEWDGVGTPEAYVISKNMHRRQLKESQLAMIAANIAKRKLGKNQFIKEGVPIGTPSMEEAARMLNVSRRSVARAKTVLKNGSPQEIKAVEEGAATVSGIAQHIKARQKNGNGKDVRRFAEKSFTALDALKEGLGLKKV
jgi:hypothetical protein